MVLAQVHHPMQLTSVLLEHQLSQLLRLRLLVAIAQVLHYTPSMKKSSM
jgi:hypothetical protein